MTTFSGINAAGMVIVTETIIDGDNNEYEFEYTLFDAGTGTQLSETRIEILQEENLIEEKTMLENRRDEDVARYNAEIAEIIDKLAAITAAKS